MAKDEIHVDDIGTIFTITIKDGASIVDVSSATTQQLIFKKPSGTTSTKTTSFVTDGSDGKIKYTTVADDIDEIGLWKLQSYIVMPSGSWKTDVGSFNVYANL